MDQLRARAFLDLLLGKDSRPRPDGTEPGLAPLPAPAGPAARVGLTVPLATLAGLVGPSRRAGRAGPGGPVAGPTWPRRTRSRRGA